MRKLVSWFGYLVGVVVIGLTVSQLASLFRIAMIGTTVGAVWFKRSFNHDMAPVLLIVITVIGAALLVREIQHFPRKGDAVPNSEDDDVDDLEPVWRADRPVKDGRLVDEEEEVPWIRNERPIRISKTFYIGVIFFCYVFVYLFDSEKLERPLDELIAIGAITIGVIILSRLLSAMTGRRSGWWF